MSIPITDQIRRMRINLVLHSIMYYHYDSPIWTDEQWDQCAKNLCKMQRDYPDIAKITQYADLFIDFRGETGFHFCTTNNIINCISLIHYIYTLYKLRNIDFAIPSEFKSENTFKKVKHDPPMYSLNKVHTIDEVILWDKNLKQELNYK